MKQFNFIKNSVGFTVVELLVSISIILILSSILLPNYRTFHYQFSLLRTTYQLAQDIRKAQEMATSAKELASGEVPPGYGIYLIKNGTSYILYADSDPVGGNEQYNVGDTIVDTINLEKIYIKEVSPSPLSINFKGPDPVTKITNDIDSVTITLALEDDPEKTQKVIVNKAGLIYVE